MKHRMQVLLNVSVRHDRVRFPRVFHVLNLLEKKDVRSPRFSSSTSTFSFLSLFVSMWFGLNNKKWNSKWSPSFRSPRARFQYHQTSHTRMQLKRAHTLSHAVQCCVYFNYFDSSCISSCLQKSRWEEKRKNIEICWLRRWGKTFLWQHMMDIN